MAYTTINKSTAHFNTKLWTGTGSSGTKTITGLNHQPDFLWIKNRNNAQENWLANSVRGAGKFFESDTANAESSDGATGLASFDSDGFTLGTGSNRTNQSGANMCAWSWKAGTTGSGSTGGSGTSKTYSYSVNTTAGFSIIVYEGNGTANHQIPHHLGVAPQMIFFKNVQSGYQWDTYNYHVGNAHRLYLDNNYNKASATNFLNSTTPTSTYINLGDAGHTNHNGTIHVAYCFAPIRGYSAMPYWVGNGNATTPTFIYTGFKPKWVLVKTINDNDSWFIHDDKRDGYNSDNEYLFADLSNAEGTNVNRINLFSNGFNVPTTDKSHNQNGNEYIALAFGQSLVGSNNVPCTAR